MGQRMVEVSTIKEVVVVVVEVEVEVEEGLMIAQVVEALEVPVARQRFVSYPWPFLGA
jgi:hypothetical protein